MGKGKKPAKLASAKTAAPTATPPKLHAWFTNPRFHHPDGDPCGYCGAPSKLHGLEGPGRRWREHLRDRPTG